MDNAMDYKTIGVVVTDDQGDAATLAAAIALAGALGAHLDIFCLGVDPIRSDLAPMGATPALAMASLGEARGRADDLATWVESQMQGQPPTYSVQSLALMSVALEAAIARAARYSDLIVAAQPYGEGSNQLQVTVLEAALFGTGAPVLMIPPGVSLSKGSFDRVAIAWNESEEALEALRKSMPMLARAERAEVVMVDPPAHSPERSDPGGGACLMLSRHGIKAEVSILSKTLPRVSDVLNRHVEDHGSDLIVMGAYGHSRFREALIGGATRDMLESARVPVLMAH